MNDMRSNVLYSVMLLLLILSSSALAQETKATGDAQTMSRGWAAVAAGRLTEAVLLADGILKKKAPLACSVLAES